MSAFAFETITPAQALAIGGADTLTVAQTTGTATGVTVVYATDGTGDIDVNFVGGQTIVFGPGFATLAQTPGALTFTGTNTTLYVGDDQANNFNSNVFSPTSAGQSGAAFGGAGNDILFENGPTNLLQGNAGNDLLTALGSDSNGASVNSNSTIYGGQGDDSIVFAVGHDFGQGNKGNDTLTAFGNTDTLLGGQGNDSISDPGDGPGNILDGNLGDDVIHGLGQLLGEGGNDTLSSTTTTTSAGATLNGGDGNDSIVAGHGHDSITGDAGNDTISVTGGGHTIAGGAGADKFIFGAGTTTPGTVPAIIDWDGSQDTLSFLGFTPNPSDFTAVAAATYTDAVALATRLTTQNHFSFVGVQVGADFIIFAGGAGGPSSVVDLVGRSLADFSPSHSLV